MDKKKVLFICTHNSARSQMAEGLLRTIYGERFEVFSAGTKPGNVNPFAIAALAEIGIDISRHRSKSIAEFMDRQIDYAVTVCDSAKETCPYFPHAQVLIHQSFSDPTAFSGTESEKLAEFERIRDQIQGWIKKEFILL